MRFLHKNPELYGGAAGLSEPVKEKTGQTFSHLPGLFFLLKAVTCARSVQVIVII